VVNYRPQPRQDMSKLVSDPSYDVEKMWPEYGRLLKQQILGQTALGVYNGEADFAADIDSSNRLQTKIDINTDLLRLTVVDGQPQVVAELLQKNQVVYETARRLNRASYMALGPLNNGEGKLDFLLGSALIQLNKPEFVEDVDEARKFFEKGRPRGTIRTLLRDSPLPSAGKWELIERIAAQVQEAGLISMHEAYNDYDLISAAGYFELANQIRDRRRYLNRGHEGRLETETLRRELDTEALFIHAHARLGDYPPNVLHEEYRRLQIANASAFLDVLNRGEIHQGTDSGRLFEWFSVLLDNYGVFNNRLYGQHYAYYAMPYQDYPDYSGVRSIGRKMSYDVKVNDYGTDDRLVAYLQMKLIIPEFIIASVYGKEPADNHSFDYYADPVDLVSIDIPIPKSVGHIDPERGLEETQIYKINSAAVKHFKLVAQRLIDHYEQREPLPKALSNSLDSRLTIGNWVVAA